MTRSPTIAARLLVSGLLMVLLAGCSSMSLGRPKVLPGVRTTASVGDKPVAVVAGLPGESIEIDTRFPGRRDRPREQISGRVVDASGRPIPNALVHLTDASGLDARNLSTETDEAGGFTIHNLRPGVRYHLAAESFDGTTDLTGEEMAEAPQTNVRIALTGSPSVAEKDRTGRTEPISRTVDANSRDDEAYSPQTPSPRTRLAREEVIDAMPPAREAEVLSVSEEKATSGSAPKKDVWRSAETDTPDIASGSLSFTELPAATADRSAFGLPVDPNEGPDPLPPAIERGEAYQSAPSRPAVAGASIPASGGFDLSHDASVEPTQSSFNAASPPATNAGSSSRDEDFIAAPAASSEPNPIPVASPSSPEPPPSFVMPSTPESEQTGFASEPPSLEGSPDPAPEPGPSAPVPALEPAGPTDSATPLPSLESPAVTPADPAPIAAPQPSESAESNPPLAAPSPAPETPAPASEEDALPPIQAPGDDLDLIDQPGHPTGSFESPVESSRSGAIPEMTAQAPDSRRPTWSDLTSQSAQKRAQAYPPSRRLSKPKSERPAGLGLLASLRNGADRPKAPTSPQVVRASCSFDKGENRLVDFTLSDLNGRPVRFQELDADYVLIDFWGTWCGPCLRSIPHLVQLQNRYDPKRLRVIGVAYERSEPDENARLVQGVMQQLGMNYPVLLGGETDQEPCPLQEAFHVQAYPTMVLVDRHGRILWRESGSNPATMTRLDRVIASNTKPDAGPLRR